MFIKKITNQKEGKTYLSYRLVKSVRIQGVPRHITILELSSLTSIDEKKHQKLAHRIEELINNQLDILSGESFDKDVEELAQFFYRKLIKKQLERDSNEHVNNNKDIVEVDLSSFETIDSHEIGGEWLCYQAIKELGLTDFLTGQLGFTNNETALSQLSLLGRLLYPASELRTARWLNENSAALELISVNSGVVDRNRLTNAAISLFHHKESIEDYLSGKLDDIFGIEDKYFLYDLTNTHFEGSALLCKKAKFGRNKQKRNDCRQITLGLLTDSNGIPKRSRYYPGNVGEVNTFNQVLADLV